MHDDKRNGAAAGRSLAASAAGVDHDLDPAIMLAAIGIVRAVRPLVRRDRPGLAEASHVEAGGRQAATGERGPHRNRTPFAQGLIVAFGADGVGVAFDHYCLVCGRNALGKFGQCWRRFRTKLCAISPTIA